MPRLPQPGSDAGTWGQILNDYLSAVHNSDGTLKDNVITSSSLTSNAVDASVIVNSSITEAKLDSNVQAKLNAGGGGAVADATSSTKGIVQLAGDLGGTAAAPTVPGLAGKADTSHAHTIADTTGLQTALDGKQAAGSYAAAIHTHTASQVSDSTATGRAVLTATDAAAARTAIGAGTSNLALGTTGTTAKAGDYAPTWTEVTSKPATFTPSTHAHVIGDTTGLQTALDGKAALSHTHTASEVSDSTATGRAVMTAVDATAARTTLGITNTVQVVDDFADVITPVYGTLYVMRA